MFLNAYYPKTELIKALNSLVLPDHLEGRLLEIPKTGFRDLFLPENYFKTCSGVNFWKKYQDFGVLETN